MLRADSSVICNIDSADCYGFYHQPKTLFINGVTKIWKDTGDFGHAREYALITNEGTMAVPHIFDNIANWWIGGPEAPKNKVEYRKQQETGYARLMPDFLLAKFKGLYGWLTASMNWAIPPMFDEAEGYDDQDYDVSIPQVRVKKGKLWGLLDTTTLRLLMPCIYSDLSYIPGRDWVSDLNGWVGVNAETEELDLLLVRMNAIDESHPTVLVTLPFKKLDEISDFGMETYEEFYLRSGDEVWLMKLLSPVGPAEFEKSNKS